MHRVAVSPSLLAPLLVSLAAGLAGCKDPPPSKLFDEEGAWSVVQYDLGESIETIDPQTRKDAFMFAFDPDNRVATTASCVGVDSDGMPTDDTPEDSPCRLLPASTAWQCQCFAYAFQDDIMQWLPFAAGGPVPPLEFDDTLQPGGGGGGGGTGGDPTGGMSGGDVSVMQIIPIPDRADTYDFRPMPEGVFGGDGVVNHFIVEARANSIFERVYADPDGRASCEPCVPGG